MREPKTMDTALIHKASNKRICAKRKKRLVGVFLFLARRIN